MKIIFKKILNLINYIISLKVNFILRFIKVKINENTLLLIRIDSIGDYILFHNFLSEVRNSNKYKKYSITLCGNILWKELSEEFDKTLIDNFIWLDRRKFYRNVFYKYNFLRQIRKSAFEVVVDTTFSREILYGDEIVRVSGAKEKIGSTGSKESHTKWKRNLFTDKFYTKLISATEKNVFEFYRNKDFFEKLIEQIIAISKPEIDVKSIKLNTTLPKNYAIIFPGAGAEIRKWKAEYFAETAKFIHSKYKYEIVLAGSKDDFGVSEMIISSLGFEAMNLSGKINLVQLSKVISDAKILVSNETGSTHIAAAVNCPFVCVSNGNHYGRFNPYPDEIYSNCIYIYPEEITNERNKEKLLEKFRFGSDLDINSIPCKLVIEAIEKLLE